jgi:RNA polymerase sigma-70 factor (ECF subfamily)
MTKIPMGHDGESSYTDDAYVTGIRCGDEVVFTALVRTYLDPLTRFAFSLLSDEDAAHDIVQDVFTRIWQLGADWSPHGRIAAYLFAAVRRRALDVLRDARAQMRAQETLRAHLDFVEREVDPYADVVFAHLVSDGILALTERQRDALYLRYGQGQTMAQVAEILGVDARAAERLIARAIASLRRRLAGALEELEQ